MMVRQYLSANACLAVAIQHADDNAEQTTLAEALKNSPWTAAKVQIARRLSGGKDRPPQGAAKVDRWQGLPAGVRLLASKRAGLGRMTTSTSTQAIPGQVAVYDLQGNAVTRVALGGSPLVRWRSQRVLSGLRSMKGLFRISRGKRAVCVL